MMNNISRINSDISPYYSEIEHLHDELTRANLLLLRYVRPKSTEHDALRRQIDRRVRVSLQQGIELPLVTLAQTLCLSEAEQDTLVLLAAAELDSEFEEVCGAARGGVQERDLTVGFVSSVIIPEPLVRLSTNLFSDDAALCRYGLVQTQAPRTGIESRQRRRVCLTPRVLRHLLGDRELCPTLRAECDLRRLDVSRSDIWLNANAIERAFRVFERVVVGPRRLSLRGLPGAGKKLLAEVLLDGHAAQLLCVDPTRHLGAPTLESFLQAARLEAVLRNAALYLNFAELQGELSIEDARRIDRVFADYDELLLVGSTVALNLFSRRQPLTFHVPIPDESDRLRLWKRALSELSVRGGDPGILARQFPLTGGAISQAAELACATARLEGRSVEQSDLDAATRTQLSSPLEKYAKRLKTVLCWEDVVLAEEPFERIKKILMYARTRKKVLGEWKFRSTGGAGVSALFSGPPGTGKTMVARVVAAELGLELFKVDLASVVSKWVGETEKNLGQIFEAAEQSHAVLLFDEADSLFAKRSEVKSANDRYANLEVNYLLQRMEEYNGICILTTNLGSGIDEAFKRRLNVRVEFPFPEAPYRTRMWRQMIPATAPLAGEIEWDLLGETYELSGGHIHNAVVAAASEAADQQRAITFDDLRQAAVHECRETGKLVRS